MIPWLERKLIKFFTILWKVYKALLYTSWLSQWDLRAFIYFNSKIFKHWKSILTSDFSFNIILLNIMHMCPLAQLLLRCSERYPCVHHVYFWKSLIIFLLVSSAFFYLISNFEREVYIACAVALCLNEGQLLCKFEHMLHSSRQRVYVFSESKFCHIVTLSGLKLSLRNWGDFFWQSCVKSEKRISEYRDDVDEFQETSLNNWKANIHLTELKCIFLYFHCLFDLYFNVNQYAEHFFRCLQIICTIYLEKILALLAIFDVSQLSLLNSSYTLEIRSLMYKYFCTI